VTDARAVVTGAEAPPFGARPRYGGTRRRKRIRGEEEKEEVFSFFRKEGRKKGGASVGTLKRAGAALLDRRAKSV
jgi:hypothetical protein